MSRWFDQRYLRQETLQPGVFRGHDRVANRAVLIKQAPTDTPAAVRLRCEFEVLCRFHHPNIVRPHDLVSSDETVSLIEEFVPGMDFLTWARSCRTTTALGRGVGGIVRALVYLHHQGITHGDLKPANVRIRNQNIGRLPGAQLIDFGAAATGPGGEAVFTLGYAAPEVLAGAPPGPAADIYALGAMICEALTGRLPNPDVRPVSDPASALRTTEGDRSPQRSGLDELLNAMLSTDPVRRPTAAAVLAELSTLARVPLQVDPQELIGPYFPVPPLVGRVAQLGHVESLLTEVHAGAAVALLLRGVGKSHFATTVGLRARLQGFRVIAAARMLDLLRAPASAQATPQALATQILDQLMDAGDPPLLLDLDACAVDDPLALELLAQFSRARGTGQLARCLLLWSEPRPGGGTTTSSSPTSTDPCFTHELLLDPLNEAEVRHLVTTMLYPLDDPPWLPALVRASRGDPGWVIELLARQIHSGLPEKLVEQSDLSALERENLAALMQAARAPGSSSMASAESAGESSSGAAVQRVLELLACSPGALPAAVCERCVPDASQAIAIVQRRGLAILTSHGLRIRSPRLKEHVLAAMTAAAQETTHQRLARQLYPAAGPSAADPAGLKPTDEGTLAHHLLRGGAVAHGARLLLTLAQPELCDLALAASALSQSSDGRLWFEINERLAHKLRVGGDLGRALAIARDVAIHDRNAGLGLEAELFVDAGQPGRALEVLAQRREHDRATDGHIELLIARASFMLGDHQGAAAASERGRCALSAEARPFTSDTARRALRLENLAALCRIYTGEEETAASALTALADQARALADDELVAQITNNLGIAWQRLGQLGQALRAFEACLALSQQSGDLRIAATAALNAGTIAQRTMQYREALERYQKSDQLATRADAVSTRVAAHTNTANLLLALGDRAGAARWLERALPLCRRAGTRAMEGHLLLYRAELHLSEGDFERARGALEQAAACFDATDRAGQDAYALLLAELWCAEGDHRGAITTLRKLLTRMSTDDPDRWRVYLGLGRAWLKPLLGSLPARADGPAGPTVDGSAQGDLPADATREHLLAAGARELALALAHAEQSQAPERSWECHYLLACCARLRKRADDGAYHQRQLGQTLDALRAAIPAEQRALFDQREDIVRARRLAGNPTVSVTSPMVLGYQRILTINQQLSNRLAVDELLRRILEAAQELTGAERGFVILKEAGRLKVAAALNVDAPALQQGMAALSQSIANEVIEQGRPTIASDAQSDPRFAERLSIAGLKLRAVLCVPLVAPAELVGALYMDSRYHVDIFHPAHVGLMQAFADQAAIALHNARLLHEATCDRQALVQAQGELRALNQKLDSRLEQTTQELSVLSERLRNQEQELVRRYNASNLVGHTKPMRTLFAQIDRVAESDISVFIHGESGTGKELVARAIHYGSPRRQRPFLTVNCAAIPESLLESELFGHVRGAFTGAVQTRVGLFEAARDGTLLLDEVGDMPAAMQVKLLRVLQDGSFHRVGDESERKSRCRVLSASHHELAQLVEQGVFRQDLFYRLNVFKLAVPPLRERRMDIPLLVQHLLARRELSVNVSSAAMAALIDYDWPGNVRQLENELLRAAIVADNGADHQVIEVLHLSPALAASRGFATGRETVDCTLAEALDDYERHLIQRGLARCQHNITHTAELLGIHRVALHKKMRRLGLARTN